MCVPLTAGTCWRMAGEMQAAAEAGADAVELRLDYLLEWNDVEVGEMLAAASRFPGEVIATYRITAEGGRYDGHEAERIRRLAMVAASGVVDYVDVEYAAWRASAKTREVIGNFCRTGSAGRRVRLILSRHDFAGTPADLDGMLAEMTAEPADVVKIACLAQNMMDSLRVLDALRTSAARRPTIALSMGETGVLTRILARKLDAHLTFASLGAGKESAPGQVTVEDTRSLYRWAEIGPATRLYGVIGCPVAHSMSPAILNASFREAGHDGVYLPMRIEPGHEPLAEFLDGCLARPWLGLSGCSVTIPHKQNLLRYVEARGGEIEPLAKRIGAANTLVIGPSGTSATKEKESGENPVPHRLYACNTDYRGALDALIAGLGGDAGALNDLSVAVLGAGGASRAIVAGLRDSGCRVTIYNRTLDKAAALAAEFGCEARPIEEAARHEADVVVNCTSIGMWPQTDGTPMPVDGFARRPLVFDTVYNPIETRLLREAREHGCRTVDGVAMFVGQAAAQFERWTGHSAPTDLMREVVVAKLRKQVA